MSGHFRVVRKDLWAKARIAVIVAGKMQMDGKSIGFGVP
jgi:hypothetical protein